MMIEDKLEIVLITYNRYKDLDNTLKQFLYSPFSKCKITILDNCSDDKTPEINAKYQKLFPNMNIIRHVKNIGGNPNILRAVETSRSLYTWVICDDDNYDFSDCSDVINAVNSEKYDLISPGSCEYDWELGLSTSVKKLIEMGSNYFLDRLFIPSVIFKTELFDSLCLIKGYQNAHNFFPFFPFFVKSLENNFSIYISKKKIIKVGTHNTSSFSNIYFIAGWINSCALIKNKNIRNNTVYTPMHGSTLIKMIIISIIFEKVSIEKDFSKNILALIQSIMSTFGFSKELFLILLILILSIIPKFLFKLFLKFYIDRNYSTKGKEIPSDWNYKLSETKNIDPLRKF